MARQPCRDFSGDKRSHSRRDGRDARPAAQGAPAEASRRTLCTAAKARLGLGGPALRAAIERQLGYRGPGRSPALRSMVTAEWRVDRSPEPAWRADTNAPVPAIALLLIVEALSQLHLPADRRDRGS